MTEPGSHHRCHSEERSDVGISWYWAGNSHISPGDCQKVNCPEGAREATLGCALTYLAMTVVFVSRSF